MNMFVLYCMCVYVYNSNFQMRKIQPAQPRKGTKLKSGQSLICCKSKGRVCVLLIRSLWQQSLLCLGTLTALLLSTGPSLTPPLRVKAVPSSPAWLWAPIPHSHLHLGLDEKRLLTLGMSVLGLSFCPVLHILRLLSLPGTSLSLNSSQP